MNNLEPNLYSYPRNPLSMVHV